ncbi:MULTISPECIES: YceI family protein [Duganella]|jgi:polyisoprenoid-binding protein YceI|uniref:Polyisoprenoid-binding protein n=2 Tax=Duganella TaxID=75654 RepID=A0ABX6MH77_9BURK|nr:MULTISPECIES: YceI family protein [Duganella]MYN26718.1 polyisoprenoid-binding protein [Duganella levis]QJD93682.1 polyisoprenoid-binding protein [Duganella dendranthematis]
MKKIVALLIAAGFSLSAFAAADTFVSDANHTFSSFSYSHFGFSNQQSRFNNTTAKVTLDRAAKTGSVEATIDAKSVDTGSKLFDGHIQGEQFLDTAKFPTITYKSTKVNFKGDEPSTVEGNLTVKGVTKPVTLTITNFKCADHPMAKKLACGANATAKIKRTEFNAGAYAPNVGDDVTLTFAIEAIKE